MNPKVDAFLAQEEKWQDEMKRLRQIALGCELTEDVKWGKPSYSLDGGNVAIIQGFKDYCALLFFKGALLKDPDGLLVAPGENSQSARQLRFTSVREIAKAERAIKACLHEAIAAEKAGLKVALKKPSEHAVPEEFKRKLASAPALKKAFYALTPGRQRAYLLHFAGAKQSQTREARIEKCAPQILQGKGLND